MIDVVGVDEVGRGAWAGPVVAGAVLLGGTFPQELSDQLRDSKVLSAKRRQILSVAIQTHAAAYSLGWSTPREVDTFGLTQAVRLAMQRAVQGINGVFTKIIMDGNYNFLADDPRVVTVVKADQSVAAVSAASIIAKVARDSHMQELSLRIPSYGFESHVGYGTPQHRQALQKFGMTDHHRKSYKPLQQLL